MRPLLHMVLRHFRMLSVSGASRDLEIQNLAVEGYGLTKASSQNALHYAMYYPILSCHALYCTRLEETPLDCTLLHGTVSRAHYRSLSLSLSLSLSPSLSLSLSIYIYIYIYIYRHIYILTHTHTHCTILLYYAIIIRPFLIKPYSVTYYRTVLCATRASASRSAAWSTRICLAMAMGSVELVIAIMTSGLGLGPFRRSVRW